MLKYTYLVLIVLICACSKKKDSLYPVQLKCKIGNEIIDFTNNAYWSNYSDFAIIKSKNDQYNFSIVLPSSEIGTFNYTNSPKDSTLGYNYYLGMTIYTNADSTKFDTRNSKIFRITLDKYNVNSKELAGTFSGKLLNLKSDTIKSNDTLKISEGFFNVIKK